MSLLTDKFFYNALVASEDITAMVDDRIYNPARSNTEEDEDRIPYIIVKFDGLQNNSETKDDGVEGDEDMVNISILCVSGDCDSLGDLTEAVRQQCKIYWEAGTDEQTPIDWNFSASEVEYDPDKPCCYQLLRYNCTTNI